MLSYPLHTTRPSSAADTSTSTHNCLILGGAGDRGAWRHGGQVNRSTEVQGRSVPSAATPTPALFTPAHPRTHVARRHASTERSAEISVRAPPHTTQIEPMTSGCCDSCIKSNPESAPDAPPLHARHARGHLWCLAPIHKCTSTKRHRRTPKTSRGQWGHGKRVSRSSRADF